MIKILNLDIIGDHIIQFHYSDGSTNVIDFQSFIGEDALTRELSDSEYFASVRIYENGRGIYWQNGYDRCPDYLRYYAELDQGIIHS